MGHLLGPLFSVTWRGPQVSPNAEDGTVTNPPFAQTIVAAIHAEHRLSSLCMWGSCISLPSFCLCTLYFSDLHIPSAVRHGMSALTHSDIKASRGVIPICFKGTINLAISRPGRKKNPVTLLNRERHYLKVSDFGEKTCGIDDGRCQCLQTFELGSLWSSSQHAI